MSNAPDERDHERQPYVPDSNPPLLTRFSAAMTQFGIAKQPNTTAILIKQASRPLARVMAVKAL
jgi:hypothetical protein